MKRRDSELHEWADDSGDLVACVITASGAIAGVAAADQLADIVLWSWRELRSSHRADVRHG